MIENIAEQAELLFRQRLTFDSNRYMGLTQLRQHDYRLMDCLQLLQRCSAKDTALTPWLHWLSSSGDPALLSFTLVQHFSQPQQAWLLLHQVKYQQQKETLTRLIERCISSADADSALAWQLAARQRIALTSLLQTQLQSTAVTTDTLWFLGLSGQRKLLPQLVSIIRQLDVQDPRYAVAQWAAYLLGQQTDEAELVVRLTQTKSLTDIGLMVLVVAASDATQSRIINYLSTQNSSEAIRAMAYSGQLKFVPLLLELAQQQDSAAAAVDALTTLLGVIEADSLLASIDISAFAAGKSGRKLAGFDIAPEQLDIIWRQGNQTQRQLAACYRFLATPASAMMFADVLAGEPADV